jgi:hypothetical protein
MRGGIVPWFLNSCVVSFTPRSLFPEEGALVTHWIRRWVRPRGSLDAAPYRDGFPTLLLHKSDGTATAVQCLTLPDPLLLLAHATAAIRMIGRNTDPKSDKLLERPLAHQNIKGTAR